MELFIDFEAVNEAGISNLPYYFCIGKSKQTVEGFFVSNGKNKTVYEEIYEHIMDYLSRHATNMKINKLVFVGWGIDLEKRILQKVFKDPSEYKLVDLSTRLGLKEVGQSRVYDLIGVNKQYFKKSIATIEHLFDEKTRRRISGRMASLIGAIKINLKAHGLKKFNSIIKDDKLKIALEELEEYCHDDVKTMFEIRDKVSLLKQRKPNFNLKERMNSPQKIKSAAKNLRNVAQYCDNGDALLRMADNLSEQASKIQENIKKTIRDIIT